MEITMRDYSMDLAKVAAAIVVDVMGSDLTATTHYSSDGNNIIMEFNGYPLYGQRQKGKVFVQFPRSTFYVRKGNVYFTPLQQSQCRYYQDQMGNQFVHPHIYNDGHPCWDGSSRERPTDFIANIIETLSLLNVTKDSVTVGLCASGIMGVKLEALENAQRQQKRVLESLKCKPIIKERRKLENYVSKRWCNKITILTQAA
ncbi:MAG: hypothetical protein ACLTXL_05840 [Clostridia bacterium]